MASVAKNINPKFIISVGDNFYDDGVASTTDSRWQSAYRNKILYLKLFLLSFKLTRRHLYSKVIDFYSLVYCARVCFRTLVM